MRTQGVHTTYCPKLLPSAGLGEGDREVRELCACVGMFEKERRNKNPNLGAVFFRIGCVLAAVCTIFYALGSFSKTSPRAASSNHQQEVLLCVGVTLLNKVSNLK